MNCRLLFAAALAAGLLASCGDSPPAEVEVEVDTAALRAEGEARLAALAEADIDGYLTAYAEDTVWMPEGAPAIIGKEGARRRLESVLAGEGLSVEIETTEQVVMSPDWVLHRGTFQVVDSSDGDDRIGEVGSYLVVWSKGADGDWTIRYEISNSDSPVASE